MINVIFMGTPDYAQKILKTLLDTNDINIVSVYTQPDKPVGRKKVMTSPEVKILADENNIPVYQPTRLRDEKVVAELVVQKCDYIVVAAYGQILPKEILDHAPCINLHASILPQYRGASPIQQTLLNGDMKTGVTAMLMEEGLDTGDILKIKEVSVAKDTLVATLFDTLTEVASELTVDVLQNFSLYSPKKQDEKKATHCKKITKSHGEVKFDDALTLYNKYRAFTPWPGIFLESGLKLKTITLVETEEKHKAGEILEINKNNIVIGCEKGSISIERVQAPSKKEVEISAYINGKRLSIENTLS